MRLNSRMLFWIFVIVLLLVLAWLWKPKPKPVTPTVKVTNFEECAQAGYPVQESYPRGCRAPDGKMFFEAVHR